MTSVGALETFSLPRITLWLTLRMMNMLLSPPGMYKSIKEYWDCILTVLIHPEDDGKGHRPDLIVDDGGDMTFLIHEGNNSEELFLKDGIIPDLIFTIMILRLSKPSSSTN